MASTYNAVFNAIIRADADGAITELRKVNGEVAKAVSKTDDSLKRFSVQATRVGTVMTAAAAAGAFGLFKLADAASAAGEAANAASVVFGESFGEIERFADGAAETIGQSGTQALRAATNFGTFGKAAGLTGSELAGFSTELTVLASDLASFKDTSPEQAILALGAALRGESEPLRQYGVLLDDQTLKQRAASLGIYDGNGALTQQQKILAANAEIFAQTSDAQGDWARTSGSLANQQRTLSAQFEDLKVEIGEGVLPGFQAVFGAAIDLLGAFGRLSPELKRNVGAMAGVGVAVAGVSGVTLLAAGQVARLVDAYRSGSPAMRRFAVGLGLVTTAVALYALKQAQAAQRTQEATDAAVELSRVANDELGQALAASVGKFLFESDNIEEAFEKVARSNLEGARRALEYADAIGLTAEQQAALERAIRGEEAARRQATDTNSRYAEELAKTGYAAQLAAAQNEYVAGVLGTVEAAIRRATSASFAAELQAEREANRRQDVIDKLTDTSAALNDIARLQLALVGSSIGVERSQLDAATAVEEYNDLQEGSSKLERRRQDALGNLQSAQVRYDQVLQRNHETLNDVNASEADRRQVANDVRSAQLALTDAQAAYNETLDGSATLERERRDALLRAQGAINDTALASARFAEEQAKVTGATFTAQDQVAAYVGQLSNVASTLSPGSVLRNATQGWIDQLNAIPRDIQSRATLTTQVVYQTPINVPFNQALGSALFSPFVRLGGSYDPRTGAFVAGATGGIVNRPTMAMIGEAGPEAVVPLSKSPGNLPLSSMAAAPIYITVNAPVGADLTQAGRQIVDAINASYRAGGQRIAA